MCLAQAHGGYPSRGLRRAVQPGEAILGAPKRIKMLTVFPGLLLISNVVRVTSACSLRWPTFPASDMESFPFFPGTPGG